MRLLSLHLEHFRNCTSERISFEDGNIHLLLGPNGSGKTNLLESIGVLSLSKSFRGREDVDLATWGEAFYRVKGELASDDDERLTLEVTSELTPRRVKAAFRNDVKIPLSKSVGMLPSVTFLPQDLQLFSGPPAERRRFLDQLLCQVSPDFLTLSAGYQKVLKQRSALLKSIARGEAKESSLSLWDKEVAARGSAITLARLNLIGTLNCTLAEELKALGEQWSDAQIHYRRKGSEHDLASMEAELLALLTENRARDLLLQSTTVGPHREDWQMIARGRELPAFASRGQERTAVLALLFLETSYLELARGEKPVVLLDDVFSELDDAHREALLRNLTGHQVFLSSTHLPPKLKNVSVWEVCGGKVKSSPSAAGVRLPRMRTRG